jgi:hypothetical protein
MITIFAIPKPFQGRINIIQRNAIKSWLMLHPDCEVILFGNDKGTSEVASEVGVRHIPDIARNESGTPLLNSIFDKAQTEAKYNMMAYVNADIILMSDFIKAVKYMPENSFLMAGQRWDLDLQEPIDFGDCGWKEKLKTKVKEKGKLSYRGAMDYFVFRRGLWKDIPPFAIGRTAWDNWLVYYARFMRIPVIDATEVVTAIHQNHETNHRPGHGFMLKGPEAERNLELAGDGFKFSLDDASLRLTSEGFKKPILTANRFYRSIESIPLLKPSLSPLAKFLLILLDPLVKLRTSAWYLKMCRKG